MLPGRGRSAASSATSSAGVWPVNRARMSSGPVMISALAWLIGTLCGQLATPAKSGMSWRT
jgi:hypothetical protein